MAHILVPLPKFYHGNFNYMPKFKLNTWLHLVKGHSNVCKDLGKEGLGHLLYIPLWPVSLHYSNQSARVGINTYVYGVYIFLSISSITFFQVHSQPSTYFALYYWKPTSGKSVSKTPLPTPLAFT